ncbi:hypothetical protein [Mesorhizobium sp. WSM3873]|uniref:hypothetical protein n=1 Tax=Mesorhizobium sp. WSM3873 TaxID=1854056 RepID=UPI0007FF6A51|nr:hypothetical protein [Mesorhizobium sp. WSM3873]OBQ84080.1 hypothetical protein A9K71_22370 [Mesorhizobium sp. WSM3873]
MTNSGDEGGSTAEPSQKIRLGMKRFWQIQRVKLTSKMLRRILREPWTPAPVDQTSPFKSVTEGAVVDIAELQSVLFDPDLPKEMEPIPGRMFVAWLVDPSDKDLHLSALRSAVRATADKLEGSHKGSNRRAHTVDQAYARLAKRNQTFYNGIYEHVGGVGSVSIANTSEQMAAEILNAATWIHDTLIMYTGLHVIRSAVSTASARALSAMKAYDIPDEIDWRPDLEPIARTPRKRKTIENDVADKAFAPAFAYAAYNTLDGGGKRLLHRILFDPASLYSHSECVQQAFRRARYVYDSLTPVPMKKDDNGLPVETEPFEPEPISEDAKAKLIKLSARRAGRPLKQ